MTLDFNHVQIPGFSASCLPRIGVCLDPANRKWLSTERSKAAAVAVLFGPPRLGNSSDSVVVLTVRSTQVRSHKGQIAFAGGRVDPVDESPRDTACRELEEELGLDQSEVTVFGTLPPISALDGSPIVPVLMAAAVEPAAFSPSPDEVSDVIFVPWTYLTSSANQRFRFNLFGAWRESDKFVYGDYAVWGLTAKIIAELRLTGR